MSQATFFLSRSANGTPATTSGMRVDPFSARQVFGVPSISLNTMGRQGDREPAHGGRSDEAIECDRIGSVKRRSDGGTDGKRRSDEGKDGVRLIAVAATFCNNATGGSASGGPVAPDNEDETEGDRIGRVSHPGAPGWVFDAITQAGSSLHRLSSGEQSPIGYFGLTLHSHFIDRRYTGLTRVRRSSTIKF